MPRGRLLKTKVKEARELAKAAVIGSEKGQMQVDKLKFNANNIGLQLKKRLLEVEPSDLSKQIAIIGVTVTIHNGIQWSKDLLQAGAWAAEFAGSFLLPRFLGGGNIFDLKLPIPSEEAAEPDIMDEILAWMISYGLAYLIVENFGAIVTAVGAGLSSILGLAKSLLGTGLIPVP